MQIVQLGIFQDVFDWVYEHLLDPMWEFVSGLLSAGFEYLSEAIPVVINAVMGTILAWSWTGIIRNGSCCSPRYCFYSTV